MSNEIQVRNVDTEWIGDNLDCLGDLIVFAPPQLGYDLVVFPTEGESTPLNFGPVLKFGVYRESVGEIAGRSFHVTPEGIMGLAGYFPDCGKYVVVRLAEGIKAPRLLENN